MSSIITVVASILNIPIQEFAKNVPANNELQQLVPDFTRQVEHCYTSSGFTDPQLGTFKSVHSSSCVMPSRCPPEAPKDIRVKFLLFLRQFPSKVFEIDRTDQWIRNQLDGKVTFVINGYFSDYRSNKDGNQTVYGFLNAVSPRLASDVVLVDYFHGDVYREQAVANSRVIGALVGQLVADLGIVSKTVCVGFSIGAHVCGFAGQWLQQNKNLILPSCIGLDPSGPGFEGCSDDQKLSIGDCAVISILHGSYSRTQGLIYGTREKSGNCDFYVNYNRREPGCPTTDPENFIRSFQKLSFDDFVSGVKQIISCDHLKTLELFNRLLVNNFRLIATLCNQSNPGTNRLKFLPPFNLCEPTDDVSYCLDIDRLP